MSLCPWCRALYSPDDHTFRLTSKRRKSRDIVQLEKKLRLGRHLQKLERKRYQKFYKESNCLILSCKRCKKSTKFKMPTPMRKETKSFMSTPVQDRVQAQHSSISPIGSLSWNTTPNNRSSSSFGNTSTPSSSTKKLKQRQKHSKLQEMLRTANHQQSFLNSPLTEFLSSV
ncbi:uncharacterized protein LOC102800493 [Saccoglossus kowalevskii]|uniref:UPF0711 protein C18orf21 homolog n=1 Tax=Saccoglossus kowalevskii TaxID=10224 RepID=A0ABM0LXU1_SACKO|nr:PREDICTED: UPF0711 protein C18orf21 homolog [Saccoglossus kowalevskii]